LPYDDFKKIYNKTLHKLNELPNLQHFRQVGAFFRNNWNNDDVVYQSRARLITYLNKYGNPETVYNPAMEFLPDNLRVAVAEGTIPQVMSVSSLSQEAGSDFISYSWDKPINEILTEKEMKLDSKERYKLLKARKLEMRKRADYSYQNKGLFAKVYDGVDPLTYKIKNRRGETVEYQVYKMVNAWGDSFRANEFYDVAKKSVIDNGFLKTFEVSDSVIRGALIGKANNEMKTRSKSEVMDKRKDRMFEIDQYKITLKPNGEMFFENGSKVIDQVVKNKVNIRRETQDGTLRTSVYNKSTYFILSDNRIVGAGKTNLGKE
jgi:hypothetical protein